MTHTELAGTVVGERYEILALLGTGGMASVYRAHDRSLGRDVALKLFAAPGSSLQRETAEIRLLASLNHHALVTLFDARVDGGSGAYLVMELVEGPTLGERITGGPVFEADAAHLLVDLADALHVVHERGIVHRDIKPANILLSASGSPSREFRAKLSDFGIAYLVDSTRLTTPGTVIGTAAYVSPEQARGTAPGPAGDIYSLGLVVLEALTAVRAFPGSMVESISARLVNDPAVPAALGAQWVALLTGMTARDPADRPSALEVAERGRALERSLHRRSGAAAGVAAVAAPVSPAGAATEPFSPADVAAEAVASTRAFPTPTRDAATEPLTARSSTPPAPPSRDRSQTLVLPTTLPAGADDSFPNSIHTTSGAQRAAKPPVRAILITGISLLAAAIVIAVGVMLGGSGAEEAAPEPLPTLPANDGDLGVHLDQLLESVTP